MNPMKRLSVPIVPMALLLLAALACGPVTTVVVTATPPPEMPTATPVVAAPTAAPPTEAPPPEPTTAAGCTLGARWVADVTVPDNTAFAPGTPFVKTWRVRNSGTCAWEPGTRLVFISGDPLGGPPAVDVPALAPGAQTDVSVSLVAPAAPGTYRANYQFQAPDGTRFGAVIWVQIVVPAPATAAPPTEAPTEAPTAPPSPTPPIVIVTPIVPTVMIPTQADLTVQAVDFRPAVPSPGSTFAIDIRIANNGLANASNFNVRAVKQARGTACPGPGLVLFDRRFSVNAGQTATFSENTRIDEAGDYSICVVLDHTGEIPETNEANNTFQKDITVGVPDLYPFYIGMNTWHPHVNQDVWVSITLRNGGNAPVSNFTVRLLRQSPGAACPGGPGLVLFDDTASLDANGSQVFGKTIRFTEAGTFQLCAILDHMNRVAESNEGNNAIKSDQNVVVSP